MRFYFVFISNSWPRWQASLQARSRSRTASWILIRPRFSLACWGCSEYNRARENRVFYGNFSSRDNCRFEKTWSSKVYERYLNVNINFKLSTVQIRSGVFWSMVMLSGYCDCMIPFGLSGITRPPYEQDSTWSWNSENQTAMSPTFLQTRYT